MSLRRLSPHLQLYISDLVPRELEFVERDLRLLEVSQEAQLLGSQDQQGVPTRA